MGTHAAKRATRWEALEPVRRCFGTIRAEVAAGLELRHDHGSQYLSADFQNEIGFLGIRSSPAFVRAPEGNGCVERAIRTLNEQLLWVQSIETVEELRLPLHWPSSTTNSGSSSAMASSRPRSAGASTTQNLKSWLHEQSH